MNPSPPPSTVVVLLVAVALAFLMTAVGKPLVPEDSSDQITASQFGTAPGINSLAGPVPSYSEEIPKALPVVEGKNTILAVADESAFSLASEPTDLFNWTFIAAITITLFFVLLAFKLESWGEAFVLLITTCAYAYYYTPAYVASSPRLFAWASFIENVISASLPAQWPKTLAASYWPIWNMIICLAIRWGIYRFVRDAAMKKYARSYWFYVAACLAFISIISDVVGISLILLVAIAVSVPLLFMAGFHRIFRDAWCFAWTCIAVCCRLMNIGWRWIVAGATWFSKEVRRLWDWLLASFWNLYEQWLANPARRLRDHVNALLASWLANVQSWTDKLAIKKPPSA